MPKEKLSVNSIVKNENASPVIGCRHFNGYKPCGKSAICDTLCPHISVPASRILIVHLEALGAVIRSTGLLKAIRRKFPTAHITWVTQKPADLLLKQNPYIDRVLTTHPDDLLQLNALEFDVAFAIDKGLKTAGVLKQTSFDLLFGFTVDATSGAVIPATEAANELWELGLSDHKKFFVNKKTELHLSHEALELGTYTRDEYVLHLSKDEQTLVKTRHGAWATNHTFVVGLNTGCAQTLPFKKMSIELHRELISQLLKRGDCRVVLLGGKEDTERNREIAEGLDVIQSPTQDGLRDGIVSVAACDIVVTGDSLGMHLAIAMKKWTVAWFGPTCSHEIDLFDRGVIVQSPVSCSPCWKRVCPKPTNEAKCFEVVSVQDLMNAIEAGQRDLQKIISAGSSENYADINL